MTVFEYGVLIGIAVFGILFAYYRRRRARRRLEAREVLATAAARLNPAPAAGGPEERLQAIAASLMALIRDKNAAMETTLTEFDQLRARMRALEQMGDLGESRALFEQLETRIDGLQVAQAAAAAAFDARVAALQGGAGAGSEALAEQIARLSEQKDAAVEAVLGRLVPFEARIGAVEGELGGVARMAERIEALQAAQATAASEIAALKAVAGATGEIVERMRELQARLGALEETGDPFAEISDQLTRLYSQKDATAAAVFARLAPIETRLEEVEEGLEAREIRGLLDRFADRLEGLQQRVGTMETAENPFAEISEQLTRLYAQKDATIETVFTRLAPLEARLGALEAGAADPRVAIERMAERLEALQARMGEIESIDTPFAEISDQLARLYSQKDATVAAVFARLAPLEARLAEVEQGLDSRDPQGALDRFAERLEALQARVGVIETAENPFAEISEQLTRLYGQKDATVETVFARLQPLEARLGALEAGAADPRVAIERVAERLEALQARVGTIETAENPFAEISDQLARLYAQKDATVATVFARLQPLEARLAEVEQDLDGRDPRSALDRFAERLEALQARVGVIETAENPFAEISEQLTRLYGQKDATVETVFARLQPLEARLGALEAGAADPRIAIERLAERVEALQAQLGALEEGHPLAEISDQLTKLYAQKDATVTTVFTRLAPIEARLAEVERGLDGRDPQAALDRFAERLESLQARVGVIETAENPFAEISEQLTRLYAQKDATVETVFVRLAPVEARLAEVESALEGQDPRSLLDRFAERLEGLQARIGVIETAESPFASISEQLTRLYAQKDARVETVFARLAPLESRLAEVEESLEGHNPRGLLDRFAERLEALQARMGAVESAENPFAEISEQLTRLYEQKDATLAAVFTRLAPLEARLGTIEGAHASRAALDGLAARLEALQARVAGMEDAHPLGEISEQLMRLYTQKDGAVEGVFARIAPLEARIAEIEVGIAGAAPRLAALEAEDPAAAIAALAERVGALQETMAAPVAEISGRIGQLQAEKDAAMAAVTRRIAPLEARLAEIGRRPDEAAEAAEAARAEARAIGAQLSALRAAAAQATLFADRLTRLEASLPKLGAAQALMMQVFGQQAPAPAPALTAAADEVLEHRAEIRAETPAAAPGRATEGGGEDLEDVWSLPRVVSLHHG